MTGQFQLAGRRVLSGQLLRPRIGVWSADLVVDGDEPLSGRVTLSTEAGTTFVGTAARAEPDDGTLRVRLIGGGGGMGKSPPAKSFRQVPLSTVLADTLSAVGETLSPSSDSSATASRVDTYQRMQRPASHTLGEWAGLRGLAWRVLLDGTVWLGAQTRTPFKAEARVLKRDGTKRSLLVATEDLALGPEHSLDNLLVGCVEYQIRPDSLRAEVLYL